MQTHSIEWLNKARFYEIYPQSFYDSNGDGVGDIKGIIEKLDYIHDLGFNALWVNPWYDSPFKDAGYDVRDFTKIAARYGTNDDAKTLIDAVHERDMHILLDLVPGHTSEEHAWFVASTNADESKRIVNGENVSERYIWTDWWISGGDGLPFIGGEAERDGTYILNFFKSQPALNYGFANPTKSWQKPALGDDAKATCDALIAIMRFWLDMSADGFRVDMADSLVKQDGEDKLSTIATWQYIFSKIRPDYPEAAFVSEWGRPWQSIEAGFDMDFYLDWRWDGNPNGYNMLLRNTDTPLEHENDASYFNADSGSSIKPFLDQYLSQLNDAQSRGGCFNFITCNHDTARTAQRLTDRELKVAYGMLMTMPGVPFLYYGDEIGMRFRSIPTKEGGYRRTGSRTPMQWKAGKNLGFSTAKASDLYLPVDPAKDAPTVAAQQKDPDSLLNWITALNTLREEHTALDSRTRLNVLASPADGCLFAYERVNDVSGERVLVAVNPSKNTEVFTIDTQYFQPSTLLASQGESSVDGATVTVGPQSFAVWQL